MQRVIWKGAISFGLVHVPVSVYPASQEKGVDFDWLDKRSMDPVGYKRINKRTGREVRTDDIVKGVKQDDGDYVVFTDAEIKAAYPKSTQTIEIEAFVPAAQVAFYFLERPYFLVPLGKGQKAYALLREAMLEEGVIGIARVVFHAKEHLAAVVPSGDQLVLNTLRWASEVRSADDLSFPAAGKAAAGLKDADLKIARQLIGQMKTQWQPDDYGDHFAEAIRTLVERRVKAGDTEQVKQPEAPAEAAQADNVVQLTELLRQSLRGNAKGHAPAAKKAAAKRAPSPPRRRKAA